MTVETDELIYYYNECWLNRFEKGHNPLSLAMHMGYFNGETIDNDIAKLNANHFLINHIGIPANKRIAIADFGCGIGGTCLYLSHYFPLAKITGINISADQIEFAYKIKKQKLNGVNVEYLLADYAETQLPVESFDFVIGIESICHARDKSRVYAEAFRLLKPGGVFAFMDYFEVTPPHDKIQNEMLVNFRKGWAVNSYIHHAEQDLADTGFQKVSSLSITDKVIPGIQHSYQKAMHEINGFNGANGSTVIQNHYKACVALKNLVEAGVIDYKIVKAFK